MAKNNLQRPYWPVKMGPLDPSSPYRGPLIGLMIAISTLLLILVPGALGLALGVAGLFWATVYAGTVFGPTVTRLWASLATIALAIGLLLAGTADAVLGWVVLSITFFGVSELLSRITGRLRAAAVTDPLTGLHNRYGLVLASSRAIAFSRRVGQPLTVAHIDLDRLKEVNDTEGHSEGDRLLKLCADVWRSEIRAGDILARIGGDEFVLVMPGSDLYEAGVQLERLQSLSPIDWCFGLAEIEPDEELLECIARADVELYAAKARRKLRRRTRSGKRTTRFMAHPPRPLLKAG